MEIAFLFFTLLKTHKSFLDILLLMVLFFSLSSQNVYTLRDLFSPQFKSSENPILFLLDPNVTKVVSGHLIMRMSCKTSRPNKYFPLLLTLEPATRCEYHVIRANTKKSGIA
jgi:hypothetical protein